MRHLYEPTRAALAAQGLDAPDFDTFRDRGSVVLPSRPDDGGKLRAFRTDPVAHALDTPSGKIEIFSETIAGFGYDDCPGHPCWFESPERTDARHPLRVIANQPATRLHSQLDFAAHSQSAKRGGREVVRMHPDDAAARGIADGEVVRLFNDRGACLATASVTDTVAPGVIQISTGAWYDPAPGNAERPDCVHGNPNVLTRDEGTSRLGQGPVAQSCLVQIERWTEPVPEVRVHAPPPIEEA